VDTVLEMFTSAAVGSPGLGTRENVTVLVLIQCHWQVTVNNGALPAPAVHSPWLGICYIMLSLIEVDCVVVSLPGGILSYLVTLRLNRCSAFGVAVDRGAEVELCWVVGVRAPRWSEIAVCNDRSRW